MNKQSFGDTIFNDESRNAFPKKSKKPLDEAIKDVIPEISDDDLLRYANEPSSLSDATLQLISASLENDEKVLTRFNEIIKE